MYCTSGTVWHPASNATDNSAAQHINHEIYAFILRAPFAMLARDP